MPTFLLGFKCAPQPEGPEQMRATAVGELACDLMMGESSHCTCGFTARASSTAPSAPATTSCPARPTPTPAATARPPRPWPRAILSEAKRLTEEGLDEAYYRRIVNANFGAALKALNSFESIAVSMAEGCFHHYDPYRFPEVYDSITQQDVLDFNPVKTFVESHMALSVTTPKEG